MKYAYLYLILIMASLIGAQDKVTFDGQIRGRIEFDAKDFNSNTAMYNFAPLRSRLGAAFNPVNDVSVYFQIQDSRTSGTEASTLSNEKNLDLHQARFVVKDVFGLPVNLHGGRMVIAFASERFVGASDWNNVSRSFDGLLFDVKGAKFDLHIFGLRLTENQLPGDIGDVDFVGLHSELNFVENYKIEPFLYWERRLPTDDLSRLTLGFYVNGKLGNFSHETEGAFQMGKITPAPLSPKDINAFFFAFNARYNFGGEAQPIIKAGIDYYSGDDNGADADYKLFSKLYGTNHKSHGFMDYFINIPNDSYGLGLTDIHGGFSFTPFKKFTASVDVNLFTGNADYVLLTGATSRNFGLETDITFKYNYNTAVNFQSGFSFFSAGEIFEETRGKDMATWAYVMTVVNF